MIVWEALDSKLSTRSKAFLVGRKADATGEGTFTVGQLLNENAYVISLKGVRNTI